MTLITIQQYLYILCVDAWLCRFLRKNNMKKRPTCAIEGCNNPALILFGEEWICGNCLVKYDRKMKENNFERMQEVLKDGS